MDTREVRRTRPRFFKAEGRLVNIGLGRGAGLDTFNANILNFLALPK
jgi:hypothetical protein